MNYKRRDFFKLVLGGLAGLALVGCKAMFPEMTRQSSPHVCGEQCRIVPAHIAHRAAILKEMSWRVDKGSSKVIPHPYFPKCSID